MDHQPDETARMMYLTDTAPAQARLLQRLSDAILTVDPRRRAMLTLWATSFVTYLLYALLGFVQVALGLTGLLPVVLLVTGMLVSNGVFYLCARLGVAATSRRDRDLGQTQLLVGIAFMWLMYAAAGPVAPATLIITASHIVYAAFSMPPRRVRWLVALSLAGLASTMTISWLMDPGRFPGRVQLVSFGYAVIVLMLIGRLANQITGMSDRLRAQRRELAAALEQVRTLASSDDLTKAHNRRHMVELMHRERVQVDRERPLCIALIDIDLFKSVNDRFGHAAGDDVLRRFSAHAAATLRDTDLFARWGGEEFMAMFVGMTIAEASSILDRLRAEVAAADFGVTDLSITFSAGLVQLCADEPLERAIERADQEMYRAKSSGRNRTCVPPDVVQPQLAIFRA